MFNEQEYKQYHNLMIPLKNGKKFNIYYKMYTAKKTAGLNLYESLQ